PLPVGRAAAAVERAEGRHEHRRAPARASRIRPPVRDRDPVLPLAPRRQTRYHRLGASAARLRCRCRRHYRKARVRLVLRQAPVPVARLVGTGADGADYFDGIWGEVRHLPLMRSALLVASELLAHRPWGWFDIDAKERLYDYAARDFETASRHWSALDTKASHLMSADAVLLGLVVVGAQTCLPTPTAACGL